MTRRISAAAPGKINVSFHVGPLREDGYHDVASLYLALDLHEVVTVSEAEPGSWSAELSEASSIEVAPEDWPSGEGNLAVRAAKLLAAHVGLTTGVAISIAKHVPVAGGMGGGSADAAAALVACDALWDTGLSRGELARLAARLGADVPFALSGGAAVGLGVGEELSPLLRAAQTWWVLIPASYGLSTPAVYAESDRIRAGQDVQAPEGIDVGLVEALRDGDAERLAAHLHNDLQAAAVSLAPELEPVLASARRAGALGAVVSGSGPTVAALAADAAHARELATLIEDETEVRTIVVAGPAAGARLVRQGGQG